MTSAVALGVGIDVLEIRRLERALARTPRLEERLFSPAERAYARRRARPARHLAARFCAKEAVAKALGLGGLAFTEVEIAATGGAPAVRLRGAAAERARELGVEPLISLTHGDEVAAAVCVLRPCSAGGSESGSGGGSESGSSSESGSLR